jgi:hypothetical protein
VVATDRCCGPVVGATTQQLACCSRQGRTRTTRTPRETRLCLSRSSTLLGAEHGGVALRLPVTASFGTKTSRPHGPRSDGPHLRLVWASAGHLAGGVLAADQRPLDGPPRCPGTRSNCDFDPADISSAHLLTPGLRIPLTPRCASTDIGASLHMCREAFGLSAAARSAVSAPVRRGRVSGDRGLARLCCCPGLESLQRDLQLASFIGEGVGHRNRRATVHCSDDEAS